MKEILIIAITQIPAAIFAIGSVWLASKNCEGWGWFVFAALCLAVTKVRYS